MGLAAFEELSATSAEVALLVADSHQHEGIGTLLVEHLASLARQAGIRQFVAEVLAENALMTQVLRDIGFEVKIANDHGTLEIVFAIDTAERMVTAVQERARTADAASLRPLLAPRSVAVIGASVHPGSVGHQVLRHIIDGGFTGTVHAVNPHRSLVAGVRSVPALADLSEAPDLAIVAVPAASVPSVVRACGFRGARSVLLLSAGFGEAEADGAAAQSEVLALCRYYGMRLLGPNRIGLLNTDPRVRLNAMLADLPMRPGALALASQSAAFGIAFVSAAAQRGLNVAQFVSVGNRADVSTNDPLLSWEGDARVKVGALYLESIRDAARFVAIARQVARTKPVLAIKSGRSAAGQRADTSHTAAAASPDHVVDAVMIASGVLRLDTMQEMLDTAGVLSAQPLPRESRVAVIGNSGGPGILCADVAIRAGLDVVELTDATRSQIARVRPGAASTQNPVDLRATAGAEDAAVAVLVLLHAQEIDVVLAVFTDVAMVNSTAVIAAIAHAAAGADRPVIATHLGAAEQVLSVAGSQGSLPVFAFPEASASALGIAWRYAQLQRIQPAPPARPVDTDLAAAADLIKAALDDGVEWLCTQDVERLLIHYGVPVCPQRVARDVGEAVRAATELGYPLAVSLATAGVHKSEIGGVRLNIRDEGELRFAGIDLLAIAPDAELLVQPMANPGTELIVRAIREPRVGPLVMLGAGVVLADQADDQVLRLTPLTAADAETMITSLRSTRLLDSYRGRSAVTHAAVCDVLVRISALLEDHPEIAELDLNSLICCGDQVSVVDARIRVSPSAPAQDPLLRRLHR